MLKCNWHLFRGEKEERVFDGKSSERERERGGGNEEGPPGGSK